MNRTKLTLSDYRFERIFNMTGNTYGWFYAYTHYGIFRSIGFQRGDYFYGKFFDKNGKTINVRFHKDEGRSEYAFRAVDWLSPHPPF